MTRRSLLVVCLLAAATLSLACGDDNGPGPSRIPNVAGNYNGTTTVVFPELSQTVSCPTSTTVTQSGSTISIAPIRLSGQCGSTTIPVGSTTIDATGSLGQESGTTSDTCGVYTYTGSGGFFGRDLRISFVYTSRTCYNMNVSINLTKS
jgi:hypothetical protein